jgi:hypothetical protein
LRFARQEIGEDLDTAEGQYDAVQWFLERGIEEEPGTTLVEDYEKAIAEKSKSQSQERTSLAVAMPFVLIVAVLLFTQWPWAGILALIAGSIVALFWSKLDSQPYPRTPWQHPLYDKDLSDLEPASVLFSRWNWSSDPESEELEVLIEIDNERVETSLLVPLDEKDYEEIVRDLISYLDRDHKGWRSV